MVTISFGAPSTQLMAPASNRIGLIVNSPSTDRFTISLLSPAVIDRGITLYPGGRPLKLTSSQHGDLVTRAWYVVTGAAQSITVLSVFLEP
jgi:hypothetical protein